MARLKPASSRCGGVHVTVRAKVAAPIHQAWTKLADLQALSKWAPDVADSHADPLRVGARRVAVLKERTYGKTALVETVKALYPHGFTYDIEGGIGPLEAIETTWRLEAGDGGADGCVAVVHSRVVLAKRVRWMTPLVKLSWRIQMQALVRAFAAYASNP